MHAAGASRRLLHGLIAVAVLVAIVVGLLLAIPGLHSVARTVERMPIGWVLAAIALEVLSCVGYIIAFLQVFERAPVRFGARVALSELAFNAAVSLGGAGSVAVGAWLLVERGATPGRVAERSAVKPSGQQRRERHGGSRRCQNPAGRLPGIVAQGIEGLGVAGGQRFDPVAGLQEGALATLVLADETGDSGSTVMGPESWMVL